MQFDEKNVTAVTIFDSYINKSVAFISSTLVQIFNLLFGIVSVFLVGKFMGFLFTKQEKAKATEPEVEVTESDVKVLEVDQSEVDNKDDRSKTDWESLEIPNHGLNEKQSTHIQARKLTKSFRRKCMSVGPIILTANSQIVRTLDVEDGVERYRYDILARETDFVAGETKAEHVCVPRGIQYRKL